MLKHYAIKEVYGMIFPHSLRHNNIYPLHKPSSWLLILKTTQSFCDNSWLIERCPKVITFVKKLSTWKAV